MHDHTQDSDFRAHMDEEYSRNCLGFFDNIQQFRRFLGSKSYEDSNFGIIDGEPVHVFEIERAGAIDWMETALVSYRGPSGALISKEAYYKAQAKKIMENHQTTIENVQQQNSAEQVEAAGDSSAVAAANAAAAASAGLGGDVKFTDASPFEATAEENFKPLDFLVESLAAGGVDPEFAERVKLGVPPEAGDASIPVGERIFMVNRSLRLCISETKLPDTIQVRMLISDKLSMDNWKQIITHGLVPALNGKLPMKKG